MAGVWGAGAPMVVEPGVLGPVALIPQTAELYFSAVIKRGARPAGAAAVKRVAKDDFEADFS